jgi:CubicO group peptidase (beta-lactamase class C family)
VRRAWLPGWLAILGASALAADIPVTGLPVPSLSGIDDVVVQTMEDEGILGCTVGVMKDGRIIYQRGFGWRDENQTVAMPENATLRTASVSKVFVKEAIKLLYAGGLDEDTKVFDLGQEGGGILDLEAWPSCQDARMMDITVQHLVDMKAGWAADYSWDSIDVYEAMELGDEGVPPPTSLEDITRFALGQELVTDPGDNYVYSNFSYNVLVLVIEELTGQSFLSYLRQNMVTRNQWVPATDFFVAQPFAATGLREPHYFSTATWKNVYDASWPDVPAPYGGFNVGAMIGSTFITCSTAPLLTYCANFEQRWIGNMAGSSSRILDSVHVPEVHIAVICNDTSNSGNAGDIVALAIDDVIGNGLVWPTRRIDGQWIDRSAALPMSGVGAYDVPYGSVDWAMSNVTGGTKLLFHSGDHPFTGAMKKKLRLDAPLGTAKIGAAGP